MKTMPKWKNALITSITAIGLLSSCTTAADLVGADTTAVNANASQNYQQVLKSAQQQGALDTSSNTAKRVHAIFNRMVPYANQANQTGVPFQWQISVLRSKEMNAWAMPGGKMAFYTGIVENINLSDDEIAAIMGHEMTHALHEHSKKAIGQKVVTTTALQVLTSVIGANSNIDPNTLQKTAGLVEQFGLNLPFSRSQEADADKGGLVLMAKAGYNPQAAVTVWEKMNQYSGGAGNSTLEGMISTHPTNNNRIDNIKRELPNVMPIYQANKR